MTAPGRTESPVDLMFERRQSGGYKTGSDSENTLAVAFNGGGLAVATEVGMAEALVEKGFHEAIDISFGESAGAGVAAAFITGQLDQTEDVFVRALPSEDFYNRSRWLSGRAPLDLAFLKRLLGRSLDTGTLINSPMVYGLGYTDMEKFEPVALTSRDPGIKESDLLDYMVWGMHMPWVAGAAPRDKHRRRVADIGLSSMQASLLAKQIGATHVVNLANQPITFNANKEPVYNIQHNRLLSVITGVWMELNGRPGSGLDYYRFTRDQARQLSSRRLEGVDIIAPHEGQILPGTLTTDPDVLKAGVAAGRSACLAALGFTVKNIETAPEAKARLVRYLGLAAATRAAIA